MTDLISDEREWSDEQNIMLNDDSLHDEIGYDDISYNSAHSPRSRQMLWEQYHKWDD